MTVEQKWKTQELLESLKKKSRDERRAYFEEHKTELLENALLSVNGGYEEMLPEYRSPNSDCPDYFGYWQTSWNFVCRGREICK